MVVVLFVVLRGGCRGWMDDAQGEGSRQIVAVAQRVVVEEEEEEEEERIAQGPGMTVKKG
jgi:hypothetical protein